MTSSPRTDTLSLSLVTYDPDWVLLEVTMLSLHSAAEEALSRGLLLPCAATAVRGSRDRRG